MKSNLRYELECVRRIGYEPMMKDLDIVEAFIAGRVDLMVLDTLERKIRGRASKMRQFENLWSFTDRFVEVEKPGLISFNLRILLELIWTVGRGTYGNGYASRMAASAIAYQKEIKDEKLWRQHRQAEIVAQGQIKADLFGSTKFDYSVLTWNNQTVRKIALEIYRSRSFDTMPVLADALEDAGYYDVKVLEHCRSNRQHYRGCFVLEALR